MTPGPLRAAWGLLALAAACAPDVSDPGDAGATAQRRDSAGVEIVESAAPAWADGEAWTVDPDPVLDLTRTGSGPGHEFEIVRDVRLLDDGRIAVVDEGVDEVRLYSPEGALLASAGREGEGPGEFRRPVSVQPFRGDSLAVWDFWLRRLTIYDGDLALGRVATPAEAGLRPRQAHWLGDSTFMGTVDAAQAGPPAPGFYRRPVVLVRFAFGSEALDTVAVRAGYEGFLGERADGRPPFGRRSQVAFAPGRAVVGDADRMELGVHGLDGTLLRILRVPGYDLSISDAEARTEMEAMVPEGAPPFIRELVDRMEMPEAKPAYDALHVDPGGTVWAGAYLSRGGGDRGRRWEVFEPTGAWLGTVVTPPGFQLHQVAGDRLAGVHVDELGVHHPRLLSLERRVEDRP